jgi:phage terminase small subunit
MNGAAEEKRVTNKDSVASRSCPKLTAKQSLFVQEYLIDLNATQAAIRAGYSKRRAKEIGYKLVHKNTLANIITAELHKRSTKTEITAERVLKELASIAFADMQNYVEIDDETGAVRAKSWGEMPEGASRAVCEIKEVRRIMGSGEGGKEIVLECRLGYKHHNKEKALELLGNHLGMWKDRQEHTFPDSEIYEMPALATPGNGNGNGNGNRKGTGIECNRYRGTNRNECGNGGLT